MFGFIGYIVLGLGTAGLVGYGFGERFFKDILTPRKTDEPWQGEITVLMFNLAVTIGWPFFWVLAAPTIVAEIGRRFKKGGEVSAPSDE